MKKFSLIALSSLAAGQFLSAQLAGNLQSYASEFHTASLIGISLADATADGLRSDGGLSLSGFYTEFDSKFADDRQYEGDREISGGNLSYVHLFDSFSVGASVAFLDTDAQLEDDSSEAFEAQGDGIVVSFGAATQLADFTLSAVGGWGELSSDAEREGAGVGIMVADYDTTFYFFEAMATYDWITNEEYSVSPSIKIGFQSIEMDGFSESEKIPALTNATTFESIEDDVPYAELELFAEYYGFGRFVPFASMAVWHDLGDSEVELSGVVVITPQAAEVADAFETLLTGTLGFTYEVNEQFDLGASVAYFSGDDLDGYSFGLSGSYRF